jgi:hypothetical protein
MDHHGATEEQSDGFCHEDAFELGYVTDAEGNLDFFRE